MKKLCTVFFTLLLLTFASVASANYPYYLNGNSDYVRVDGHMGTAWYVDKTSLVNQMYAPPYYKLAINVVTARVLRVTKTISTTAAKAKSSASRPTTSTTTWIQTACVSSTTTVIGATWTRKAAGPPPASPCRSARWLSN